MSAKPRVSVISAPVHVIFKVIRVTPTVHEKELCINVLATPTLEPEGKAGHGLLSHAANKKPKAYIKPHFHFKVKYFFYSP